MLIRLLSHAVAACFFGMEIRQLRYFAAAAELLNFTRAAEALRVAQPALSRQIRSLEEELGVTLIERDSRRVALTPAGKLFQEDVIEILEQIEAAEARIKRFHKSHQQVVSLGFGPSLLGNRLPLIIRRLAQTHPRLKIEMRDLTNEDMVAQIRERMLDAAIIPEPSIPHSELFAVTVLRPICFAIALPIGHKLRDRKELSVADISHETLIAYDRKQYADYWELLQRVYRQAKCPLMVDAEVDGYNSLAVSVQSGQGLAIVASTFEADGVVTIPLLPTVDLFNLAVLHHRDLPKPVAEAVVGSCNQILGVLS